MSGPRVVGGVTRWVENPSGGRDRGPRGLGRAWLEVLVRPRRFFRYGVAPGDQAPGLIFAIAVAFCAVGGRLLLAPESLSGYVRVAAATGRPYLTAILVLGVACFLVAPLVLHLAAALATLSLLPVVEDRAGVSETVQVIAYAAAPCVAVATPVGSLEVVSTPVGPIAVSVGILVRIAATAYASLLLGVGLAVVHRTTPLRAAIAAVLPAAFVFGAVFGGFAAIGTVVGAG